LQSAAASLSNCYTKFANEIVKLGSMSQPHARQVIEAHSHADTVMSHFASAITQKSKFIQQQVLNARFLLLFLSFFIRRAWFQFSFSCLGAS
jgi:hypothetical protein